jgi:hypothetical protein
LPEEEDKEAHDREEEEAKTASLDYLSPFLVNVVRTDNCGEITSS